MIDGRLLEKGSPCALACTWTLIYPMVITCLNTTFMIGQAVAACCPSLAALSLTAANATMCCILDSSSLYNESQFN